MAPAEIGRQLGLDSGIIRVWIHRFHNDGMAGADRMSLLRPDARKKGYIHYVDNPGLMNSMLESICACGVDRKNVTVGTDFSVFAVTLSSGDTVVVNSLFDLSSEANILLSMLIDFIDRGITLKSISDDGLEITPEKADTASLLTAIQKHLSVPDVRPTEAKDSSVKEVPVIKRRTNSKLESYKHATAMYMKGYTMAYSARVAGCDYHSFRYWLITNGLRDAGGTKVADRPMNGTDDGAAR